MRPAGIAAVGIASALLAPGRAAADPPPSTRPALTFRADRLDGDLRGDARLEGNVELAYERYRLRASRLRVQLEGGRAVFVGDARVALCPCPEPPISFLASGGSFEPPGDLRLRWPRIAVGGVPVFGLPWLWLRAPAQVGVLPPLVAVRGADGVLLGSGVHLPWRTSAGEVESVDLSAGGYVKGGAEIGVHLATTSGDARVTADLIRGTRVALEARGAVFTEGPRAAGVAWSLDAIRGDRARSGTIDLEPAARPFDVGAAEVSTRAETTTTSSLLATGVVASAPRGEGTLAAGPRTLVALGGPLGASGSWTAEASGAVLGGEARALSFGRAAAGAELDTRPGPFELRASARARGRFTGDGSILGPSTEVASATRADLDLPFARSFGAVPGEAPLVHWITPGLSLRGALASQRGAFFQPIGGTLPGASWLAASGVSTAIGRYAGSSVRLDLRAGASGGSDGAEALAHARLGADARVVAASIEGAAVGDPVGQVASSTRSAAFVGRVRVGDASGLSVRLDGEGQAGRAAGKARAIAAGAWAALPGDDLAYFAAAGWTGGAEVSVPLGHGVRTTARADVDFVARQLLALRTSLSYRHVCRCFGVGVVAGERVGREGVDVAFAVDLAPR